MEKFSSVEDYIDSFPDDVKPFLNKMRQTIIKAAPKAVESVSYGMAGYKLNGVLVYFGGFKKHYSLFALPKTNIAFAKELKEYKTSKGTIQFSLDKPFPAALITKIVKARVKENLEKEAVKNTATKAKKK